MSYNLHNFGVDEALQRAWHHLNKTSDLNKRIKLYGGVLSDISCKKKGCL